MIDIDEVFKKTKKYYKHEIENRKENNDKKENKNENKNFYISRDDINGFHLGIYPNYIKTKYSEYDYIQTKYSEYEFGNFKDMERISISTKNDIFKSFNCSLCSIQEEDNYYEINPCGNLEQMSNLALLINHKIISEGIVFLLTGTSPQYYYNHLLLSTLEHYTSYYIFEDFSLFNSVYKLIENFNKQNNLVKFIFNGNFGSDKWHFHTHVTDQFIHYVDQFDNILETTDLNGEYGIIKYKILADENLNKLYNESLKYTSILYDREYYEYENKYLSGIFKTINVNNKTIYCLFLVTGNKYPNINYQNNLYRAILPSAILNVSENPYLNGQDLENITKMFKANNVYYDWDLIKPIKRNENLPMLENFEKKFRKQCPSIDHIYKNYKNVFYLADKCLLNYCKREKNILAIYKYIISLFFSCLSYKYKYNVKTVYDEFLKNPKFIDLFVKSNIGYLTTNFEIKDSQNLFIKGPFASKIFENSVNNLSAITQTDEINYWLNYKKNILGEESGRGVATLSSLNNFPDIKFVIKINKYFNDPKLSKLFEYEYNIGKKINDIRSKIPNFVLTLEGFSCWNDKYINTLCQRNKFNGEKMQFILLEYLEGITLSKYISKPHISDYEIFLVIKQLSLALLYSQINNDFTHNDLHGGNILLSDLPEKSVYSYLINGQEFNVNSYVNCTIIDYGTSHIKGSNVEENRDEVKNYGFTRNNFNGNRDIYTLIMSIFRFYCVYKKSLKEVFDEKNILAFIIKNLFESYSEIFIENAFEYIKNKIFNDNFINLEINEKNKLVKDILNYVRKKEYYLYFLYLPPNYPSPKNGIFSSMGNFVKFLNNVNDNINNKDRIFQWGDYEKIGCPYGWEYKNKEDEIKHIKKILHWESKKMIN